MKHAETELFPGFITGWQRNHWCSSVSCQDLNRQELPVAPQWHCWMQCARSASHVRILWKYADGVWDIVPGGGFPQSCVLPFTPVQVGRLSFGQALFPFCIWCVGPESLAVQSDERSSGAQISLRFRHCQLFHLPCTRQFSASPPTLQSCHWNSLPDWRIPMNFSEFRYFDFDAHHHKALWQGCEWMWEAVLFLYWNFTDFIPGTQSSSHGLGFCRKQLPRQLVRGMEIVQTDTKRGKGWMRVFPHSRLGRQCWAKGYPVLSQAVKRDGCSSEGGGERALLSRCAPRSCSQGRCCPSAGTYPQHLSPELYMEALKLTPWFHSYHSLKWRPPGTSKLLQRSHTPSSLLE